jgi:hypothetical protein
MLDGERFYDGPSVRPQLERAQSQSLEVLASLILLALVVAALYVARALFIPIAIAIVVSLVLSSPIRLLRRWGRLRELCDETKANFCAAAFKDALDYCLDELRRRDKRDG